MNFNDIKLSSSNYPTLVIVKAYDLDKECFETVYLTHDKIVRYLVNDGEDIFLTVDPNEGKKFDHYIIVSKIPPIDHHFNDFYKSNISTLKQKFMDFYGTKESSPSIGMSTDFSNHVITDPKIPGELSSSQQSMPPGMPPGFFVVPKSEPEKIWVSGMVMIPGMSEPVPGLMLKYIPNIEDDPNDIIYWYNVPQYLFGYYDGYDIPIIREDFEPKDGNFRDEYTIVNYIDDFKNTKRDFSRLKNGHLEKQIILSGNNLENERIHFRVYCDKYIRLEVVTDKESELVAAFIQDQDEFLCIYYISGHISIVSNDVSYDNTNANPQYHDSFPFYKLDNVGDLIDICFDIAYQMMSDPHY